MSFAHPQGMKPVLWVPECKWLWHAFGAAGQRAEAQMAAAARGRAGQIARGPLTRLALDQQTQSAQVNPRKNQCTKCVPEPCK